MKPESSFKSCLVNALGLLAILMTAVLGYGYWHSITHASFNATVEMVDKSRDAYQKMPLAEVTFKDSVGRELAKGFVDEQYNFVHLLHPDVGDCHEFEKETGTVVGRTAWQECFATMSTWVPRWAEKVAMADVVFQEQTFNEIPLNVSAYNSEWYYWWVPLPHVGGKPYTYYRTKILVHKPTDQP